MSSDSNIHDLESELELKQKELLKHQEKFDSMNDKSQPLSKFKLRPRDKFRYVLGGLIQKTEIRDKYPQLINDLYELAKTKHKIKFVNFGLINESQGKLIKQNKFECQSNCKTLKKENEKLSKSDRNKLLKILEYFQNSEKELKKKLYGSGREGEMKVYVGDNLPIYISNDLAVTLRDRYCFST